MEKIDALSVAILKTSKEINEVASLFDAYRVFYGETSDLLAAKHYLQRHFKQKSSIIIGATMKGKIIGFSQLYASYSSVSMKELYVLNDLYVEEEYRSKGVGEGIIRFAQNIGLERGWKGMVLETAKDNPAQKLYEKTGWVKDTDFWHYSWMG